MASDRDQALKAAEKLIKAGKKNVALAQFRKISTTYPDDLALHNRIGDMLCLGGLGPEAVPYYEKVAFAYRDSGFMPKAVAMFKKILRQQPDSFETMVELGNLYINQRLPGEARNYLLHAADQYIRTSGFQRAGEIYRTLIEAEPDESSHRIRLAETLAASGQKEEAASEMLATAETVKSPEMAETRLKMLRRAMEISPDAPEPALAVARCLAGTGQADEAMQILDERINAEEAPGPFIQAKLKLILASDEPEAALDLFNARGQDALDGNDFARVLDAFRKGSGADLFWERIDPWLAGNGSARAVAALEAAAELEKPGYVPALTRLARHIDGNGDAERTAVVLERLINTLHVNKKPQEASVFEERLRELRPDSPALRRPDPAAEPESPSVERPVAETVPQESEDADKRFAFQELEAPAVPLNKTDEEFASGRLTQAEILEKYGLEDKALDQVREVVERFPGHVTGQKRLIELLKPGQDKTLLRDAWIGLAFAERASGNMDEARNAATLAAATGPLEDVTRQALEAFHLIGDLPETRAAEPEPEPAAPEPIPEPTPEPTPEPVEPEPAPEPAPETVDASAAPAPDGEDDDVDVMFEEEPAPDIVTGRNEEEGNDLASLAAALEGELFLDDDEPLVPEAPREQSLDEVFAAFQAQVEEQVDADDFQTHYDLGIAYREMGLLDEAIAEFKRTVRPGAFHRESCIMIASCHRDAGRVPDAAEWYRKALEIPNDDEEAQSGLRYDLAEVLAEIGEMQEALGLYRTVMEVDPSFRDISERISQLENHLGN